MKTQQDFDRANLAAKMRLVKKIQEFQLAFYKNRMQNVGETQWQPTQSKEETPGQK